MLPKKHRLTRSQVERLMKYGATFHSPHLSLRVLPSSSRSYNFGFVASRKISPGAVGRNRLRRRGYGVIERLLPSRAPHIEGIFFFKRGSRTLTTEELVGEVQSLLTRCHSSMTSGRLFS